MKVALVYPFLLSGQSISAPLGLLYIASVLKKDHDIKIIDSTFSKSIEFIKKELIDFTPEVVGISSSSAMAEGAFKTAEIAKRIGSMVVLGGVHSTLFREECIKNKNIDFVIPEEGEIPFKELVAAFESVKSNGKELSQVGLVKGVLSKNHDFIPAEKIEDLDVIPFPAWELLPTREKYLNASGGRLSIIASRGCIFRCSYCQPTLKKIFGEKVRMRSPKNVVDEIEMDVKKFGAKSIAFQDDTFTWNKEWLSEVCDLMKKKFNGKIPFRINSRVNTIDEEKLIKLKKAGCSLISFGVESGSQRILDEILHKGIKTEQVIMAFNLAEKVGIRATAYIMLGNPTETKEDIEKTISLLEKINPFNIYLSVTNPLPHTDLYSIYEKMDILIPGANKYYYRSFDSMPLRLKHLKEEDINKAKERIEKIARQKMIKHLIKDYARGVSHLKILSTVKLMREDFGSAIALKKIL